MNPAAPSKPDPGESSSPWSRRWWRWALAAILAALLAWRIWGPLEHRLVPPLEVPVPADLAQQQPQLRAYLTGMIDWVRDSPRDMDRHATLGIAYGANLLWNEARMCFENAALLNPEEPLAHLYLAIATLETGDQTTALALLKTLCTQFPTFPQGFYRLGELALRLGATDDAEFAFQRLNQLAPDEWRGYAGLGEVALRRGHHQEAATHLEKAIEIDPQAANAHSLLGLAYRGLGRSEEAELELCRGLDAQNYPMPDPWGETAHLHMRLIPDQLAAANRYSLDGTHDRAISILTTALNFDSTNVTLMNGLGMALNRGGQPAQAQAVCARILQIDPNNLAATIAMSLAAAALDDTNQALQWADQAIQLSPASAQTYLAKANALLAGERDAEALDALLEASRYDPKNAGLHLQIGDVLLLNLDRADQALEHYRTACGLNPALVSAQIRMARMLIEQENTAEAKRVLTVIRRLDPANPALAILERQLPPKNSSSE